MGKQRENLAIVTVLAVVYFCTAKLGLRFAFVNPSATALWAPTGITLAAFLIFGFRVWPGAFAGAFFANLTTAGTALTSIGVATGNTLEGVVGCYLIGRFARGPQAFERAQDIFKFAFLAGIASTAISATIGVASLSLAGFADWREYGPIWRTWWLGDGVGAVVVTPLVLLWKENPRLNWTRKEILELALLFLGLFFTVGIVFGGRFHSEVKNYPLEYLCIPFLIWAAFRFGRRKAATATCVLAGIAIWGTIHGFGPFSRETLNTSLLLVQSFVGIVAVTSLALAAEVSERKRADERVQQLVATDPLTGLANYRRLIDAIELEIKRYERSVRPFAILLFDLDELKQLNDTHGHLVGSRALCRVGEVLRAHCRQIDTPARFGGDEFAVVLPETTSAQAQQIAARIRDRIAADRESPPISTSVGSAVFPDDGDSIEKLLSAADRALYGMKRLAVAATSTQGRHPQRYNRE
ncbi:MAG TPA: MASE1 domain-containing protein [Candidatus Limnocylindrales bacterium]|nr:MASE1 domain-containing protein [Candidatus Limnocylindrales bacterium]